MVTLIFYILFFLIGFIVGTQFILWRLSEAGYDFEFDNDLHKMVRVKNNVNLPQA